MVLPTAVLSPRTRSMSRQAEGLGIATGKAALGVVGFAIACAVWWLLALVGVGGNSVPRPDEVLTAGVNMFREQGLLLDIRTSMTRVMIGVAIGCGLALPVGFVLAWNPLLRAMFDPLVSLCRALPPIALIPLVIVYLGIGETARISILVYASFFSAVVVLFEGISGVDPILVRAAKALGANRWEIFAKTVVPASVPHVFTAVRVAIGVSWATLVAAELIAAELGLGAAIKDAANFNRIADVCAGIIMVGLSALLMDLILKIAQRRMTRWQEKSA